MVIGPVGPGLPSAGDLVRAVDRDGKLLGYGLWNPRSQISLRLLSREAEPPGPEFWTKKIASAIDLRQKTLGLDEQATAYRVLHAEGDGLSGLIADRFDDVLSIEIFSLGMYQRIGPIVELCAAGWAQSTSASRSTSGSPFRKTFPAASSPARSFHRE